MIFLSVLKAMVVFLKECFEKVDFEEEKKSASDKKICKITQHDIVMLHLLIYKFYLSDPLSSRLFFNENGSSCLPIRHGHKAIPGHFDDGVSYLTLALEVALIGRYSHTHLVIITRIWI